MRYALTLLFAALLSPVIATGDWIDVESIEAGCQKDLTAEGRGTWRHKGHSRDIEKAKVHLHDHKLTCTPTLEGGKTIELNGQATDNGLHRHLVFKGGHGDDKIDGRGEMSYRSNEDDLESISGSGEMGDDHFSFSFTSRPADHHHRDDDWHNRNNDDHHRNNDDRDDDRWHDRDRDGRHDDHDYDHGENHSFSDNVSGYGYLKIDDDTNRISTMRVSMARNGDLHLKVEGPHSHEMEYDGRWSGDGPEYKVRIRSVNDHSCDIEGTMKLSSHGRHFESISLDGEQGRDDDKVKLYFHGH